MEGPGIKFPGPHDHWFNEDGVARSRCCDAKILGSFTGTLTVEASNGGMTQEEGWPDGLKDYHIVSLKDVTDLKYTCAECGREVTFTWEANTFWDEFPEA